MISAISCTRCTGQVIEREGLDGYEKLCLNCGFGQVQNIIPTEALAAESLDYNLRNKTAGILTTKGMVARAGNNGRGFQLGNKAWIPID